MSRVMLSITAMINRLVQDDPSLSYKDLYRFNKKKITDLYTKRFVKQTGKVEVPVDIAVEGEPDAVSLCKDARLYGIVAIEHQQELMALKKELFKIKDIAQVGIYNGWVRVNGVSYNGVSKECFEQLWGRNEGEMFLVESGIQFPSGVKFSTLSLKVYKTKKGVTKAATKVAQGFSSFDYIIIYEFQDGKIIPIWYKSGDYSG